MTDCTEPEDRTFLDDDFARLANSLWRGRWWIVTGTAMATLIAIAYAFFATEWYRAETSLVPRDAGRLAPGFPAIAQLGGLADLTGIGTGQASRNEALAVLKSQGFARRFLLRSGAGALLDGNSDDPVLLEKAIERLTRRIVRITDDKRTGIVRVTVLWTEPGTAASWANAIARQINAEMRERALEESSRNLTYLRAHLSSAESIALQQAIARLLESEMQRHMVAEGTDEYAYRVIDVAERPARKARPRRLAIIILGTSAGFGLASLLVLISGPVRRAQRRLDQGKAGTSA